MSGFLTESTIDRVLDSVFGGLAMEPPPTLYLGLSLSPANRSGLVVEPSAASYRRMPIGNNLHNFTTASGGRKTNLTEIVFPVALEEWGFVVSLFLADSATGGNVIAIADTPSHRKIGPGSPAARVRPGALFLAAL